jgi:hypothetical protein
LRRHFLGIHLGGLETRSVDPKKGKYGVLHYVQDDGVNKQRHNGRNPGDVMNF